MKDENSPSNTREYFKKFNDTGHHLLSSARHRLQSKFECHEKDLRDYYGFTALHSSPGISKWTTIPKRTAKNEMGYYLAIATERGVAASQCASSMIEKHYSQAVERNPKIFCTATKTVPLELTSPEQIRTYITTAIYQRRKKKFQSKATTITEKERCPSPIDQFCIQPTAGCGEGLLLGSIPAPDASSDAVHVGPSEIHVRN